jgi:hypothetical protein
MPLTHPPKLHLNENLSPRLAAELRRYGFDVTSSQEKKMLSAPDDVQLAYAISEQRAIVSFNTGDFAMHLDYSLSRSIQKLNRLIQSYIQTMHSLVQSSGNPYLINAPNRYYSRYNYLQGISKVHLFPL